MDTETEKPTELADANAKLQGAAQQIDQAADTAYQATADALAEIPPEVAKPLLAQVTGLLGLVGGKIEGAPTTLADPAVVRALSALADLSQDAVEAQVVDPEMALDVGEITDANSARLAAGKLAALAKNREFQRWAKSPAAKKPEAPKPPPAAGDAPDADTDTDTDDLFQRRMGP